MKDIRNLLIIGPIIIFVAIAGCSEILDHSKPVNLNELKEQNETKNANKPQIHDQTQQSTNMSKNKAVNKSCTYDNTPPGNQSPLRPIPGLSLLDMPVTVGIPDHVKVRQGETKILNFTISLRSSGNVSFWISGARKCALLPDGLEVSVTTSKFYAEAGKTYTSSIIIRTSPELCGCYSFYLHLQS